MSTTYESAPQTILRREEDLPFVTLPDGTGLQLLQVDLARGVWVVRTRFPAGTSVQTHRHTGDVYAFTVAGSWHYRETPDLVNVAGAYLYEPAGSVHTLTVPASNDVDTDVFFTINGANLNLDERGDVVSVVDAHTLLPYYRYMCAQQHGVETPPVVVLGEGL
jgi:2,4'-dihydroxyacetophenone dioxygenase